MHSSRKAIGAGYILVLSEGLVVNRLGPSRNGALLSNLIQLSLGILVVVVTLQTARRSGTLERYFWHLTALAYSIGALAQALSTYSQSFYPGFAKGFTGIPFAFWFVPMGMALFLKQDSGYTAFDWLANIDLTQAVLFWVTAYVCLVRMPWGSRPSTIAHLQPFVVDSAFAAVLWSETTELTQGLSRFLRPDALQGQSPSSWTLTP